MRENIAEEGTRPIYRQLIREMELKKESEDSDLDLAEAHLGARGLKRLSRIEPPENRDGEGKVLAIYESKLIHPLDHLQVLQEISEYKGLEFPHELPGFKREELYETLTDINFELCLYVDRLPYSVHKSLTWIDRISSLTGVRPAGRKLIEDRLEDITQTHLEVYKPEEMVELAEAGIHWINSEPFEKLEAENPEKADILKEISAGSIALILEGVETKLEEAESQLEKIDDNPGLRDDLEDRLEDVRARKRMI